MKKLISIVFATTTSTLAFAQAKPSVVMGQGLFEQPGSNSCMFCHGTGGHDGKIKEAANLTKPKTWKTYKGLGGDAAFNKDKEGFRKNMAEAVQDLIKSGAIAHNSSFKKPYFDWKKSGTFNTQMLGLTSGPSKAWLDRFKAKGITKEIAAEAAYMYVTSLDTEGVFAK